MSDHHPEQPNVADIQGTGITLDENNRWGPYLEGSRNSIRCHVYVVTPNPFGFPFSKEFIVGVRVNGPVRFVSSLPDEWYDYIDYPRKNLKPIRQQYGSSYDNSLEYKNAVREWESEYKLIGRIVERYFAAIVKKYC